MEKEYYFIVSGYLNGFPCVVGWIKEPFDKEKFLKQAPEGFVFGKVTEVSKKKYFKTKNL